MEGIYFYLGACTQGKISAFHRKRAASPTHTEVSVISVFFKPEHIVLQVIRIYSLFCLRELLGIRKYVVSGLVVRRLRTLSPCPTYGHFALIILPKKSFRL